MKPELEYFIVPTKTLKYKQGEFFFINAVIPLQLMQYFL